MPQNLLDYIRLFFFDKAHYLHRATAKQHLLFFSLESNQAIKRPNTKKEGSRAALLEGHLFRSAFDKARERIKSMNVQFVEETNPVRQAMLEICASLRAKAKHNNFDNH